MNKPIIILPGLDFIVMSVNLRNVSTTYLNEHNVTMDYVHIGIMH